ncbi:hypothetical protein ACFWIQ_39415, partial [Kitasatospora sp. NPDC127059]
DDLVDQGAGLGGAVVGDYAEHRACLPDPRCNAGLLGDHQRINRGRYACCVPPGADPQVSSIAPDFPGVACTLEFEEHFDKRRVELGSCGRPYGTPCAHEHACIRCPMLSINPKMIPRLDELEQDLLARRDRAMAEGWQGEIEGLDLTLTFLRSKREQTRRFQRQGPVPLGLPVIPHQEPQVTDV